MLSFQASAVRMRDGDLSGEVTCAKRSGRGPVAVQVGHCRTVVEFGIFFGCVVQRQRANHLIQSLCTVGHGLADPFSGGMPCPSVMEEA